MHSRLICCLMLLAFRLAATPGSTNAAPPLATTTFDVSLAPGARQVQFTLPKFKEAGCIIAQVPSWSGNTSLTLTIQGESGSSRPVSASQGPLWVSYEVSSRQASQSWVVEAQRGSSGRETLRGRLVVEYPTTQVPCLFTATPATGRKVNLAWKYNGRSFTGSFIVERSSDLRSWQAISDCTKPSGQTRSSCSDKVNQAGTYWYRVCTIGRGSRCGSSNVTPPHRATVR
jgi:hypothetical protein